MIANIFFGSQEEKRENLENILSPYNKEIVSQYPLCSVDDTKKALNIAKEAFKNTKNSTISQRVQWLNDVAKTLEVQKEDIAQTISKEVAKPITFARVEVSRCIETIKLTASAIINLHGETINTDAMPSGRKTTAFYKRVPAGVIACITPFNFPLNLVAHKIAPAIAAGNSVVLKPTPEAPLTAYKFMKIFIDSPFAIKDAISLVYGDAEVGNTLVTSDIPRVVSFTGSVPVGNIITKNAGIKKVSLELGGNAGTYIESTANINEAAQKCAVGAFINSGQVCISLQRIYVDSIIYEEFAAALKEETQKLIVGSPYEDNTFLSSLINEESLNRARDWIASAKAEGATQLCGDEGSGNIFKPTVMTNVTDDMNIVCQEVFAPIVSLIEVNDFNETVEKINNSPYGLQFSIFTNRMDLVQRTIDEFECGGIVINDIPTLRFDIQPYGGIKQSGIGKEGPTFAIEEFTEIKSVVIC
jgi:acyl-CoA reductase-like NAD-dependent aldehyde dehydrogenase